MKKYKTIALGALIATGFASCELTEKPTSYYEKHQKLKDAMEKLDARFGKGTVIKASLMKKEPDTKEKDEKIILQLI